MIKPTFFRVAIVRPGQLRAPLFGRYHAPWDKVGPRLKRGMERTRSEIDNGAGHCVVCGQRLLKHDDNTVLLIELGYDEDDRWLDMTGGACCEQCSQLSDYELRGRVGACAARPRVCLTKSGVVRLLPCPLSGKPDIEPASPNDRV